MNNNLPILALDLATSTGWALSDRNGVITSGVQTFDLKRGESAGMRFLRFRKWIKEVMALGELGKQFNDRNPGLIGYEQAHHRGGASTQLCVGMCTDVLAEAALYGLDHVAVHTASLKKFSTGKGKASKEEMIAKAKEIYPQIEIIDDNHADALLLLNYVKSEVGLGNS